MQNTSEISSQIAVRDSMLQTGQTSNTEKKAGEGLDDKTNARLLSRLECLTVGKYLTNVKQDHMVDTMRSSLQQAFFVEDPDVIIEVFKFLNLTEVMKMTQLARQINIVLQENLDQFTVLITEPDWPNIKVIKQLSRFPNMTKIFCRHFLTNIDF